MTVRVGINGFGRIGRQSLKAIIERAPDVEVVAVNDLVDVQLNALLFKHDSTYGAYPGTVEATTDALIIDGREIRVRAKKDPAELPWRELGVATMGSADVPAPGGLAVSGPNFFAGGLETQAQDLPSFLYGHRGPCRSFGGGL
jgi:hypothetical protein